MMDGDIHAYFTHQKERHEEAKFETDMDVLPGLLGCRVIEADASRLIGTDIHVRRRASILARRSSIAHELAHKLALEDDPCYEDVIRHRHRSVPHMDAHLECLTEHGQDALLMPDKTVQTVLEIGGLNARAVWLLHQTAEVYVHEALRRLVHFDENAQIGGFVAHRGRIIHAYSYRWRMPCWIGHPVPDAHDGFEGDGVSLFDVPGRAGLQIGLVVI